jgi:hypothetical protein
MSNRLRDRREKRQTIANIAPRRVEGKENKKNAQQPCQEGSTGCGLLVHSLTLVAYPSVHNSDDWCSPAESHIVPVLRLH